MSEIPRETVRAEVLRCGRNPIYYIEKYVKIRHPIRGLIPFSLFPYQKQLIKNFLSEGRFDIVLKARQLGITEVTAAFVSWLIMFYREKTVLNISTKEKTAASFIKKVKTALEHVPPFLKIAKITTDNLLTLELNNGSRVEALPSSEDAGRSSAVSFLFIDEAAFIRHIEPIWASIYPTIQTGGRCVVVSTPNGVGGVFYRLYTEAENGVNSFRQTRLMWWEHPEHTDDLEDDPERPGYKTSSWYRSETKNMSSRDRAQEYECSFNFSGNTVIGADQMLWLETTLCPPLQYGIGDLQPADRALFVWSEPMDDEKYLLTCDVSRGDGNDSGTVSVFNYRMEQVAEFCAKVPPDELGEIADQLGRLYNNGTVIVENNSYGLMCLDALRKLKYPAIFYSKKNSEEFDVIHGQFGPQSKDLIPGLTTSSKTRPTMIGLLEKMIREHEMLIRSRRLKGELDTFIWDDGRPEAIRGCHDDLVMSTAIAAFIYERMIKGRFRVDDEDIKSLLDATSKVQTLNTQIPGASKDPRLAPARMMGPFGQYRDPYSYRVGNVDIDLSELLEPKVG